jgi:hypothetical protein
MLSPENDPARLSDVAFEPPAAIPANGKATTEAIANAKKHNPSTTMFAPASRRAAEAAKKGTTSTSRTGKAKQVSYEFGKPPKGIYVKVHPAAAYHTFNLPVFVNENEGTFHYIDPELFDSGELPERFRNVCKLMDIHTAAVRTAHSSCGTSLYPPASGVRPRSRQSKRHNVNTSL